MPERKRFCYKRCSLIYKTFSLKIISLPSTQPPGCTGRRVGIWQESLLGQNLGSGVDWVRFPNPLVLGNLTRADWVINQTSKVGDDSTIAVVPLGDIQTDCLRCRQLQTENLFVSKVNRYLFFFIYHEKELGSVFMKSSLHIAQCVHCTVCTS